MIKPSYDDDEPVRAEFVCDSDEERREAHEEEVNERQLARECGELDEGQDESDERIQTISDIAKHGICETCSQIFYPGVEAVSLIRRFNDDETGEAKVAKAKGCAECVDAGEWAAWIEVSRSSSPKTKLSAKKTNNIIYVESQEEMVQAIKKYSLELQQQREESGSDEGSESDDVKKGDENYGPLDEEIDPKAVGRFHYVIALYDYDGTELKYDDVERKVLTVTFDISRYGEHQKVLVFETPLTEKEAVERVEDYLSQPITKEYFELVKDDLFENDLEWPSVLDHYGWRGALLTDCLFLESFTVDKKGNAVISCGS